MLHAYEAGDEGRCYRLQSISTDDKHFALMFSIVTRLPVWSHYALGSSLHIIHLSILNSFLHSQSLGDFGTD